MMLAVEGLMNLDGVGPELAIAVLERAGFEYRSETSGGYVKWIHPDRSQVWIRPNGEVVRLGPKVKGSAGKMYHPRYDQHGLRTRLHSTGERIAVSEGH